MSQKPTTVKTGIVTKVIKPHGPGQPEKAEIAIEGADDLYKEIRIENKLEDAKGHQVKLKEHAHVEIRVEADPGSTVPVGDGSPADSKASTGNV